LAVRRIFWKQLDVVGTTMGSPDDFHAMMALLSQGGLHPVVDTVFPLAEVAAALHRMDEAAQFGKIVLRIS
jgi:NADPH:quinone reductase-like Zn-dependent oxidoreductase